MIEHNARVYSLHYGTRTTSLATVRPDERYPEMYRIHWPDGIMSDMVNLTRAKDAAKAIAARKLSTSTSVFDASRLKWKIDH